MTISDFLERARLVVSPEDEPIDVPDDVSGLLDEDLLPPDPKPGKSRGRKTPKAGVPGKATAAQKRQVADALVLIQTMIGGTLQMRDPVCGHAVLDHAENVADKAVPIICRNPAWLRWFTGSTGFLDILGLAVALKPVAATVWGHHMTHTLGDKAEEQGVDYSAYAAPSL